MTINMLEIILVRHGETNCNRDKTVMGHLPIPLNRTGQAQAQELARQLKKIPIEACYSSPLVRTLETSRIICGSRRISLYEEKALAEIDYGAWVGKPMQEIAEAGQFFAYMRKPAQAKIPGGESLRQAQRRSVGFIETLRKQKKGGRVLVVSHADVIKAMVTYYLGLRLNDLHRVRIDNGSMSLLWFHGKWARVLSVNVHNHFPSYFGMRY